MCRPEALGVLAGAVFLISLFLFIPIPFLHTHLLNPHLSFEHHEVTPIHLQYTYTLYVYAHMHGVYST